jgi:hypothetical protein
LGVEARGGLACDGCRAGGVSAMATKKAREGTCCCGKVYRERGGKSSHRCPAGKRKLCEECVTEGKTICPTHQVRVKF